ncbi:MAG TPA: hypothetical protein VFE62_01520 [Gemmataceae bacterium]|nr:hypothetical protein [Gemmataceae bacterium]
MEFAQIVQVMTAATAVLAIVVGPCAAVYVAKLQIRASVVSNNRQQWINSLRDTLSEFLAKQLMVRSLNAERRANDLSLPRIEDTARLTFKIRFLLADEPAHNELAELVSRLADSMNQQKPENRIVDVSACLDRIEDLAISIFKHEWERVKAGD